MLEELSHPQITLPPWFGVTLADFVMPFFLFLVGVSVGLAFKKISNKTTATKNVMLRAINLFLLGLLLQGGYFHGRRHLTYGVDVRTIRWLGVLQRISIGYLLASMSELWLVNNIRVDSLVDFARKYYIQWVVFNRLAMLLVLSIAIYWVNIIFINIPFTEELRNAVLILLTMDLCLILLAGALLHLTRRES